MSCYRQMFSSLLDISMFVLNCLSFEDIKLIVVYQIQNWILKFSSRFRAQQYSTIKKINKLLNTKVKGYCFQSLTVDYYSATFISFSIFQRKLKTNFRKRNMNILPAPFVDDASLGLSNFRQSAVQSDCSASQYDANEM